MNVEIINHGERLLRLLIYGVGLDECEMQPGERREIHDERYEFGVVEIHETPFRPDAHDEAPQLEGTP